MISLIYILIIFFVCLIGYQLFLALSKKSLIEGMTEGEEEDVVDSESTPTTNTTTSTTDTTTSTTDTTNSSDPTYQPYQGGSSADQALSLSKQNQYNIEYLQSKYKEIEGVKTDIDRMKQDIDTLNTSVNDLAQSAGELGTELTGGQPQDETQEELGNIDLGTSDTGEITDDVKQSIDEEDGEEEQTINL
jgi:hypothetical protein